MAKAQKLSSGRYRTKIYDKEIGKWKSFTADTAKRSELLAAIYVETKKEERKPANILLSMAMDNYIDARSNVLSPSTIAE